MVGEYPVSSKNGLSQHQIDHIMLCSYVHDGLYSRYWLRHYLVLNLQRGCFSFDEFWSIWNNYGEG